MGTGDLPFLPTYDDAWNGAVIPAILGDHLPAWAPSELRAKSVVLLVLDGLGWDAIGEHAEAMPTLSAMSGGPVSTVVPSTTAAGLTSIVTGLTPAEHGILGYRMRVGGEVLNILQWRTAAGEKGPDPASVQPHAGFLGHDVPQVTRADFGGTGFTGAHLRTGRLLGWRTSAVLVERCRRLVEAGEPFVYAYYDGVDKVAHEFGLRDEYFAAELRYADRLVADLLAVLPSWCALAVTADHGQVHVGPEGMRDLDAVAGHVAAYAGEGRFRTLFARPGSTRRLAELAQDAYGEEAWVLTREQVWESGWLGPRASATVQGRLGDVIIAARAPVAYVAPDAPQEARLIGCHGSLTAAEMQVPLLTACGTG
jgi:predicted AlkP superfamily pyrophosphatase or phosphodiesterase